MNSRTKLPTVDDCSHCGVCCLHMGYPPYLGMNGEKPEPAWEAMPNDLKQELLEFKAVYEQSHRDRDGQGSHSDQLDSACVWFDQSTKACKHHEFRPKVCRDFQVGSKGCRDWRRHYGIAPR